MAKYEDGVVPLAISFDTVNCGILPMLSVWNFSLHKKNAMNFVR